MMRLTQISTGINSSMAYSGFFTPSNPSKWIISKTGLGHGRIRYRSSWERKFMAWADRHPSVLKVASEEVVVPYISPIDGKRHRYYIDFYIEMVTKSGDVVRKLIEVKPRKETKKPRQKKNQRRYLEECRTYAVNQSKWVAAKGYAEAVGMEFVIMDEYSLGIKQ